MSKMKKSEFGQRLQSALTEARMPIYTHKTSCECDVCFVLHEHMPNLCKATLTISTDNHFHGPRFKLKSMKNGTVRIKMFSGKEHCIITPTPESAIQAVVAILHLLSED